MLKTTETRPVQEKNQLTKVNWNEFDFLDFGSGKGSSFTLGKMLFAGEQGLGIDVDAKKVKAMREAGHQCLQADVARLKVDAKSVRFVILGHVLEHLHSLDEIKHVLQIAVRAARDFLFIHGPCFDSEAQLNDAGLKFYWSDWTTHTTHLTTTQLESILGKLDVLDWQMMGRGLVWNSESSCVHALESPPNQRDHDSKIHPPKPHVDFSPPLFREYYCCVRLTPNVDWNSLINDVKEKRQCLNREIQGFFG